MYKPFAMLWLVLLSACVPPWNSLERQYQSLQNERGWTGLPSVSLRLEPTSVAGLSLLAKAQPDECYGGSGLPPCVQGQPKVNQAYVWGMAKVGPKLWWGTVANMLCQGLVSLRGGLRLPLGYSTEAAVCHPENPIFDHRVPQIWLYDSQNQTLREMSSQLSPPAQQALSQTVGLRSAGAIGQEVFLAGPSLDGLAVNLFVFAASGRFLGFERMEGYNDVRKWVVAQGALYVGVGRRVGGGAVLRYRSEHEGGFAFEEVGRLASMPANLAVHQGRLFATTWPDSTTGNLGQSRLFPGGELAGLYMSPPLASEGLSHADAMDWQKLWSAADYEPDGWVSLGYLGGDLASFDGYLYWGTMHVPFFAYGVFTRVFGTPPTDEGILAALLATQRATAVFRGRNFGTPQQQIELLYGDTYLPSYWFGQWVMLPNHMGPPKYGRSGFGNPYNAYAWSMAVHKQRLYVGTFDWSHLAFDGFPAANQAFGVKDASKAVLAPPVGLGADLYRFDSSQSPAVAVHLEGLGNPANYGVRTLVSDGDLYIGTANAMNLLGPPAAGGWELLRYRP